MRMNETWPLGTASVTHNLVDGISCFTPRGVLTGNTVRQLFASVAVRAERWQLSAYLLRFDDATLFADELHILAAAMEHAEDADRPKVPAAIMAGPDALPQFVRHSVLMNEQGFCRRAFSELPPAMSWLQRMALIHLAWVEEEQQQCRASATAPAAAPACPASLAHPAARRKPTRAPLRQD
jgi:hypothetical protein